MTVTPLPGYFVFLTEIEATSGLKLGNEFIEFKARFGGTSREIMVPVSHIIAIYARENGQGMAFPAPSTDGTEAEGDAADGRRPQGGAPHLMLAEAGDRTTASAEAPAPPSPAEPPEPPTPGRPALKRVK